MFYGTWMFMCMTFQWTEAERKILREDWKASPLGVWRVVRNYRGRREILDAFSIHPAVIDDDGSRPVRTIRKLRR
jgi:hypothetical protein